MTTCEHDFKFWRFAHVGISFADGDKFKAAIACATLWDAKISLACRTTGKKPEGPEFYTVKSLACRDEYAGERVDDV